MPILELPTNLAYSGVVTKSVFYHKSKLESKTKKTGKL